MKTYNFLVDKPDSMTGDEKEYRDSRNGIICVNPTFDLECYRNYIKLLNTTRDKWVDCGYLDIGMMPLAMGPSFMQAEVRKLFGTLARNINIPVYSMPAVSLYYKKCMMKDTDIWVFKSDVAMVMGMDEDQVSLESFIGRCIDVNNAIRNK